MITIIALLRENIKVKESENYSIDPLIILDGIVGAKLETKKFVKMMINCWFPKEHISQKEYLSEKMVYHLHRFNLEPPKEVSLQQVSIIKCQELNQSTSTKNKKFEEKNKSSSDSNHFDDNYFFLGQPDQETLQHDRKSPKVPFSLSNNNFYKKS